MRGTKRARQEKRRRKKRERKRSAGLSAVSSVEAGAQIKVEKGRCRK